MLHVVERQHRIKQHEPGIVGAIGIAAQIAEHGLEPGGRAIAEVADGATGEARQARHERRPEVGHQRPQRVDERPVGRSHRARPIDRGLPFCGAQDQERVLAEKGIPCDVFPAFDALE